MSDRPDWNPIRALAQRVLRENALLVLTDDIRALLLRSAREVAIDNAEDALSTVDGALDAYSGHADHRLRAKPSSDSGAR